MSFKVRNEGSRATVYMYGAIGPDYWDPESATTAKDLAQTLDSLAPKPVDIRIDSCGGDVYEGFAIAGAIQRYPGETVAHIDGIAASAASYVALSADRVEMSDYAWLMVHNAWTFAGGNRDELRAVAEQLEGVDASIATIISARSGLTPEEAAAAMSAETWYTAEDALAAGMCDEVVATEARIAARVDEKVAARFRNMPDAVSMARDQGEPSKEEEHGEPAGSAQEGADAGTSHIETIMEDTVSAAPGEAFVLGNRVYRKEN